MADPPRGLTLLGSLRRAEEGFATIGSVQALCFDPGAPPGFFPEVSPAGVPEELQTRSVGPVEHWGFHGVVSAARYLGVVLVKS